jgi:hypothetical protein
VTTALKNLNTVVTPGAIAASDVTTVSVADLMPDTAAGVGGDEGVPGPIVPATPASLAIGGSLFAIQVGTDATATPSLMTLASTTGGTYLDAPTPDDLVNKILAAVVAPASPTGLTLAPASDTGTKGDGITSVSTPIIIGQGVTGDTITLFDGTAQVGTVTVGSDGTWSVTTTVLASGSHSLTATQTDTSGNPSAASTPLLLTILNGPSGPNQYFAFTGDNQSVLGTTGNDAIYGSGNFNMVSALDGADFVSVVGNNNAVDAGPGNDMVYMSGNMSFVLSDPGVNTIYLTGSNGTVAGGGNDVIYFRGSNLTFLDTAGSYNDTLIGFEQASGDRIRLVTDTVSNALNHATLANGGLDTQITLADSSVILLKNVNHIDSSFFS